MKLLRSFFVISLVLLGGCNSQKMPPTPSNKTNSTTTDRTSLQEVTVDENFPIAMGQSIYVPIYSYIYYESKDDVFNLAATLSIRNTDINHSIIIKTVNYYDSTGKLVKDYLANPIRLNPLASTEFVIRRTDTSGGAGANFIVEWIADQTVSEPIVEAVMISAISTQGISFTSQGKVIKNYQTQVK